MRLKNIKKKKKKKEDILIIYTSFVPLRFFLLNLNGWVRL
jgi:hypothetical protein